MARMSPMIFRHRISTVFSIVGLCIFLTTVTTFWFGRIIAHKRDSVLAHHTNLAQLELLLSSLKDAETGQRGFLLTGDESYLIPYQKALDKIPDEIKTLQQSRLAPGSAPALDTTLALVREKLDELKLTIDLRKNGGLPAALDMVRTNEGKHLMDEIRSHFSWLQENEETALQADLSVDNALTFWRTWLYVGIGLIDLAFLYWAFLIIQLEIKGHQAATIQTQNERDEVRRQKDLLNVTLSSIGDCVIVTDKQGIVTFINAVAEELTGWTHDEAVGTPVGSIFKIINEQSRNTVESPVEKVLRLGKIVGLANHTLLIRKDGTEVPIDDSGSPVREPDGTIRGVVLVFRDFTEHKNAEKNLERAKLEAEAANNAKDQFLAVLSHELRTPLTPILTTFNIWEIDGSIPEALKDDVRMIRHNIELEARLIDDLLDLTRIAKGGLHLSPQIEDLHALLESVLTMQTSEIQTHRLQLALKLDAARHFASVDPARAQQIFWNLLKNATKFTPAGGSITITSGNDSEGRIVFRFIDTGIGITPETLKRLFLPFEQGEHRLTHRFEGLGLGLSICKSLVEAQGGSISAASEGKGKGATFTVTFPVVQQPAAALDGAAEKGSRAGLSKHSLRIMLLEDHSDSAGALARLLARRGHQVETITTIQAARELLGRESFDLLLCDLGLPDGSGVDFLMEARKNGHAMPAIALSGFGMEEDVARCEQAGFFTHLTKPVEIPRLEAIIDRISRPQS